MNKIKISPMYLRVFIPSLLLIAFICVVLSIYFNWDERSAQWVSAIGTWVGGLFTGCSLLFFALQLNQVEMQNLTQIRKTEQRLEKLARSLTFRVNEGKSVRISQGEKCFSSIQIKLQNKTSEVVNNLSIFYKGVEIAFMKQNNPGANDWAEYVSVNKFSDVIGDEVIDVPQSQMNNFLKNIRKSLVYKFEIDGVIFKREDGEVRKI